MAAALDGDRRGTIWGFYAVELPSGVTEAVLTTAAVPPERRPSVDARLRAIDHPVKSCSAHIVGFDDDGPYAVAEPAREGPLARRFRPPGR